MSATAGPTGAPQGPGYIQDSSRTDATKRQGQALDPLAAAVNFLNQEIEDLVQKMDESGSARTVTAVMMGNIGESPAAVSFTDRASERASQAMNDAIDRITGSSTERSSSIAVSTPLNEPSTTAKASSKLESSFAAVKRSIEDVKELEGKIKELKSNKFQNFNEVNDQITKVQDQIKETTDKIAQLSAKPTSDETAAQLADLTKTLETSKKELSDLNIIKNKILLAKKANQDEGIKMTEALEEKTAGKNKSIQSMAETLKDQYKDQNEISNFFNSLSSSDKQILNESVLRTWIFADPEFKEFFKEVKSIILENSPETDIKLQSVIKKFPSGIQEVLTSIAHDQKPSSTSEKYIEAISEDNVPIDGTEGQKLLGRVIDSAMPNMEMVDIFKKIVIEKLTEEGQKSKIAVFDKELNISVNKWFDSNKLELISYLDRYPNITEAGIKMYIEKNYPKLTDVLKENLTNLARKTTISKKEVKPVEKDKIQDILNNVKSALSKPDTTLVVKQATVIEAIKQAINFPESLDKIYALALEYDKANKSPKKSDSMDELVRITILNTKEMISKFDELSKEANKIVRENYNYPNKVAKLFLALERNLPQAVKQKLRDKVSSIPNTVSAQLKEENSILPPPQKRSEREIDALENELLFKVLPAIAQAYRDNKV